MGLVQRIAILLLISILIGSVLSINIFLNRIESSNAYGTEYRTSNTNSEFVSLDTRIFGRLSDLFAFSFYQQSFYGILRPDQNVNEHIFDNYANNGTFELLEVNLTENFNSVQTIAVYNLPSTNVFETSINGVYFDGEQFWALQNYPSYLLMSFAKNGTIMSNNTLNFPTFTSYPDLEENRIRPLGIYD